MPLGNSIIVFRQNSKYSVAEIGLNLHCSVRISLKSSVLGRNQLFDYVNKRKLFGNNKL